MHNNISLITLLPMILIKLEYKRASSKGSFRQQKDDTARLVNVPPRFVDHKTSLISVSRRSVRDLNEGFSRDASQFSKRLSERKSGSDYCNTESATATPAPYNAAVSHESFVL